MTAPTTQEHALSDEQLQALANGIADHLFRHYGIALVGSDENAKAFARAAWSASPGPRMREELEKAAAIITALLLDAPAKDPADG